MKSPYEILVVIPARANSERFPNKNVAPLKGKPLIQYSIDYALANLNHMDFKLKTIVSTNDPAAAAISDQNGVSVLIRPDELSGPLTSTAEVLKHVSAQVGHYDYLVLLQPTNPLRPQGLMIDALKMIISKEARSLFSVTRNTLKLGTLENGSFEPFNYSFGQRSQDMSPLYFENGLIYIAHKSLIDSGVLMEKNSLAMEVNHPFTSIDIDYPEDMLMAEFMLERY